MSYSAGGKLSEVKERASVYHKSLECTRDLYKGCLKMYQLCSVRLWMAFYFKQLSWLEILQPFQMLSTNPVLMAPISLALLLEKLVQGLPDLSDEAFQIVLSAGKGGAF